MQAIDLMHSKSNWRIRNLETLVGIDSTKACLFSDLEQRKNESLAWGLWQTYYNTRFNWTPD